MEKTPAMDSVRPSLERLKALDSLPDIDAQLQEAKRLCNHSARADMVCKWLLERIKSKNEFRGTPEAWETLLLALRLLSPQRVAILLSTHGFLGICQTTLEDEACPDKEAVFFVLVRVLSFLVGVSDGPQGTQLKAVLSLRATQAAAFLDIWIQSALSLVDIALFEHNLGDDLLRPGIEIWNNRKRSADENGLFAKQCLLSTARLLPVLNQYDGIQRPKRKRDDSFSLQQNYKQILESMLARHVFVPARTAFFKAREALETKGIRQIDSQDPAFVLQSMFEPLRKMGSDNSGLDEGRLAILPHLLDIAMRCTPTITPKQCIKEKPWLDAVFKVLHECNSGHNHSDMVREALRDMLSSMKGMQVSPSKDILESIIERHSGLGYGEPVDWKLVSRVIELDSEVFSNEKNATVLFSQISGATVGLGEDTASSPKPWMSHSVEPKSEGQEFMDFLRKHIVAPVMETFADRRKLGTFVDIWAEQMLNEKYEKISPLWAELENDFAPLLEGSLTESQILELFDRYSASIKTAADDQTLEVDRPSQLTLRTSIVILGAIFSGIRSETLANALHEKAGELFITLLGGPRTNSLEPNVYAKSFLFPIESSLWTLLTKLFETWFPVWATAQDDAKAIAIVRAKIADSAAVDAAESITPDSPKTKYAAKAFTTSIFYHLHNYGQQNPEGINGGEKPRAFSTFKLSFDNPSNLLQFPPLMEFVESPEFVPLINRCTKESTFSAIEASKALVASRCKYGSANQVEDLVELFVGYILREKREDELGGPNAIIHTVDADREVAILKVISGLPPNSLLRKHREKLINAICQRQRAAKAEVWSYEDTGHIAQAWRFALLVTLMTVPNATCNLAVDPDALWQLAQSVVPEEDDRSSAFLEELTSQLSNHLLATQDQERSKSMLIGFSDRIKQCIEQINVGGQMDTRNQTLAVVKTLLTQLEVRSREELKSKFVHREPEIIKEFLGVCLNSITFGLPTSADTAGLDGIQMTLALLLATPESLVQLSGIDTDFWHEPLNKLMRDLLTRLSGEGRDEIDESQKWASQRILIDSFQLACKISTSQQNAWLSALAQDIACLRLPPTHRDSFMVAFGRYEDKLQRQNYVELLESLLDSLHDPSEDISESILPLVEVSATKLSNADLQAGESPLPRLLSKLLSLAVDTRSLIVCKRAVGCIATSLKSNSSLANQYSIEMILTTLKKVFYDLIKAQMVYLDACQIMSILLLQYRSRLHGRFHLVIQVFQAMLSRLFQPMTSDNSKDTHARKPSIKHAQAFSKIVTLFCEPPQFKRASNALSLVDESRKEQAHVGKSVQYLLHHYCSQALSGRLEPGMREAITPGLWSIIEAMEMGEAEGMKSLSAAMNNSERAVLRGVYDDWRRFGKWRGA